MKKEQYLYIILILTIIITRISVFLVPEVDIIIFNFIIHHFWFGILLFIASLLIPKKYTYTVLTILGIGLGLILDQIFFMAMGGGKDYEYWQLSSTIPTIILALSLYPFKKALLPSSQKK